jgi:hypothetical protein
MQNGSAVQQDRERYAARDCHNLCVVIETRQPRPRFGERNRQQCAAAQVDPKQIAYQLVVQRLPLDDCFGEAVQPKVGEKETEGCDHSHKPEVGGHKDTRENHRGSDLHHEAERLGQDRNTGTADGVATQLTVGHAGVKIPGGVEGSHDSLIAASQSPALTGRDIASANGIGHRCRTTCRGAFSRKLIPVAELSLCFGAKANNRSPIE